MYFQIKKEPRMAYVHKIFNSQRDHEKEKKYSFQYIYFPKEQKKLLFFLNWVNATSAALSRFPYDTITHSVYL